MKRTAIIVTGLPANGKTTIAVLIGQHLAWPVLDKDTFLEVLYGQADVASMATRRTLSQKADLAFQDASQKQSQAVLVSHWRPRLGPVDTGTPTDWVTTTFDVIHEIHCACSLETAITRFHTRTRHPGHLDATRTETDVRRQMQSLAKGYPLGLGALLTVDTMGSVDRDTFLKEVTNMLAP